MTEQPWARGESWFSKPVAGGLDQFPSVDVIATGAGWFFNRGCPGIVVSLATSLASPQLDARSILPLIGDNQNCPQTQKCPWRQDHPRLRTTVPDHLPGLCPPFLQISPLRPTLTHPFPPPRPPAPTHFTLLGSSKQLSSWLHGGLGSSSLLFPDRSPAPDTQLVSIHICWVKSQIFFNNSAS